jgi:hypothetical protein
LTPEANSQIHGAIQVTPKALANSIYSTIGNVNILSPSSISSSGAPIYSSSSPIYFPDMNTGANNEIGRRYRQVPGGIRRRLLRRQQ